MSYRRDEPPIHLHLNNSTVADESILVELERLPWQPLIVGSETYFLKLRFLSDSYALLVTDMLNVWYCHSDPESVIDEKQRFNSNLDMAIDNILQMMFQYFKLSDASVSYSVSVDDAENKLIITQEATIDFFFFKWVYTCTGVPMRNSIYIRDHLIKPLLFMNFELQRELALMKDEIKAKDREIQAYINKGQRIMKGIATPTFVDDEWTTKQLVSVECLSGIPAPVAASSVQQGLSRKLFELYAQHVWPPAQAAPAPDDTPAPAAQPSLQPSAMVDPLSSPRLEHGPPDDHSRSDRVLSQEEAWDQRHGGGVPPGAPGVLKLPSLSASMPAPSQTLPPPPAAAPSADKPKRRVRTQTPDSGASQPAPAVAHSAQSHDSKEYVESAEELKRREAIERKLAQELEKKAQKAEKATKKKKFV